MPLARPWPKLRHSSLGGACTITASHSGAASAMRSRNLRVDPDESTKRIESPRAVRYETCGDSRSMHWPRSISAISPAAAARSPASTTRTRAPHSTRAVLSRSRRTPPQPTCGLETTGTKHGEAPANIRRRPAAWSLREAGAIVMTRAGGSMRGDRADRGRRREDEADVAAYESPRGTPGAAQRALHEGVRRQPVPVLGDALAVGDTDDGEAMADRG